ncbi:MAG: hypothetical protein P9M15_01680 [Candidatus Electryoneaceae bacterium]|nr:hypothetical protein [Candidatus Electryoneaceae bacterium]
MSVWENIFGRKKVVEPPKPNKPQKTRSIGLAAGDSGQRKSIAEHTTLAGGMSSMLESWRGISPWAPAQILDFLSRAAHINPLVNEGWRYFRSLASSGHKIVITDRKESDIERINEEINNLSGAILPMAGGIEGLIDHCLQDLAIYGALSFETILTKMRDGVLEVALVPVRQIRFELTDGQFVPHQLTNRGDLIQLDPKTYKFSILDFQDNSPYPIPPFMSSIPSLLLLDDINTNVKYFFKKFGGVGLVNAAIHPPEDLDPANPDDLIQLNAILNRYAESLAGNLNKGLVVTFDDIELKHFNPVANATGSIDFLHSITEDTLSGMGIEGAFIGRAYKPVLAAMQILWRMETRKVRPYQRRVAEALRFLFRLHLALKGIDPAGVSVEFNENFEADPLAVSQAKAQDHARIRSNVTAGYISADEGAREMGYASADNPDLAYGGFGGIGFGGGLSATKSIELTRKNGLYQYERPIVRIGRQAGTHDTTGELTPPYSPPTSKGGNDVGSPTSRGGTTELADSPTEQEVGKRMRNYLNALQPVSDDARKSAIQAVEDFLANSQFRDMAEDTFGQMIWRIIQKHVGDAMSGEAVTDIVSEAVEDTYKYYRIVDRSAWEAVSAPATFSFSGPDTRAISALKKLDRFYLGKFVRNEAVEKTATNFLQEQFLEKGAGLFGRTDPTVLDAFKDLLSSKVKTIQTYQAQAIVNTSVVRMRSYGQLNQMREADVKKARWVTMDGACDICSPFDGMEWEIAGSLAQMDKEIAMTPEEYEAQLPSQRINPGLNPDEVKYELDHNGKKPPLHTRCKCRIVAVV